MKIAVSSKGAGLGAWLEPQFGMCNFLVVVDENNEFDVIENTSKCQSEDDEKRLAGDLIEQGIGGLVTGTLSDSALQILKDKGILVYLAEKGSILELVEKVRDNQLPITNQ